MENRTLFINLAVQYMNAANQLLIKNRQALPIIYQVQGEFKMAEDGRIPSYEKNPSIAVTTFQLKKLMNPFDFTAAIAAEELALLLYEANKKYINDPTSSLGAEAPETEVISIKETAEE